MAAGCQNCEGCGYVSSKDGRPWSEYVGSDVDDQTTYWTSDDIHNRKNCPKCNGSGVKHREDEDDTRRLSPIRI